LTRTDDPALYGPDPFSGLPGYALRRAANAMMADLAGRLVAIDLKISEASALLLVGNRKDVTSSEIGKALEIQRANMVPLLNRLEASGLIVRRPIDRKSQAIVLTAEGQETLEDVRRIFRQFEDDLIARIPARHRPHFMPALQALTD
jgi:DNA-binding MarR family transcriptional regulator